MEAEKDLASHSQAIRPQGELSWHRSLFPSILGKGVNGVEKGCGEQ